MSEIEVSKSKREPDTGPKDIFSAMRDEMNRVLERFEGGKSFWSTPVSRWVSGKIVPELDVRETDTAIIVEAELPGVDESKIEASFDRGVLKVMAPKSAEAQKPERKIPIGKS